jgi:archaellum biogenesis ATPase FlaH/virulence-associated protein VagC
MDIRVEWVVEKCFPKQSVIVLHGRGGIGKTWLMLQCGSCVAEGKPFAGLATQKMPCYYIDFENSLATLHDRAIVLGRSDLLVWHVSNPIPPPRLDSGEWVRYKALSPGLLIFDTLRASQLLDENSSRDMTLVMMRLKELRDMGFTVVLIHHTPKSDDRIYKGSTAIQDQCDHVLSLDRVKGVGSEQEIDVEEDDWDYPLRLGVRGKTRYEPFSIYLQFDPNKGFEVAPDPDEDNLKNIHSLLLDFKVKETVSPNQTQIVTLAKDLGLNRKKLLRLLRKGEGRLWHPLPQSKNRAILYDPISVVPLFTPYIGRNKGTTDSENRDIVLSNDRTTILEPVENTLLSHCSDALKNNGITGNELQSDYEVMGDGQLTY